MTKRLLDFNPLSGEKVWFQYEHSTDRMVITHEQDVEDHLKLAHHLTLDDKRDKKGRKEDWWHYAHVPNAVILEMKEKHGVDFFDKAQEKRVFALLNTEYKRLKTTNLNHNVR